MKKHEILEHAADMKIRAFGKSLEEVFVNSACGMMEYIYPHTKNIGAGVYGEKIPKYSHRKEIIEVTADDLESLLVNWLSEILYLSDANNRVYFDFEILDFGEFFIKAKAKSCAASAQEDIKAATYNEIKVEKRDGEWVAEVVYDI